MLDFDSLKMYFERRKKILIRLNALLNKINIFFTSFSLPTFIDFKCTSLTAMS